MKEFMEEIYQELNLILHEIEDVKYYVNRQEQIKFMFKVGQRLVKMNEKIFSYLLWGIK